MGFMSPGPFSFWNKYWNMEETSGPSDFVLTLIFIQIIAVNFAGVQNTWIATIIWAFVRNIHSTEHIYQNWIILCCSHSYRMDGFQESFPYGNSYKDPRNMDLSQHTGQIKKYTHNLIWIKILLECTMCIHLCKMSWKSEDLFHFLMTEEKRKKTPTLKIKQKEHTS